MIIQLTVPSLAVLLIAIAPARVSLQTPRRPAAPAAPCDAPVWGDMVPAFETRVQAYIALRQQLESQGPSSAAALAGRIRAARATARPGEMFTAALAVEIKKSLTRALDSDTLKVIMDDNPGEIPSQVNDEYREGSPLSSMPPNILAALPRLPEGVEYRFVERHLILLDTPARVVIDRIPYAIGSSATAGNCR